MATTWLMSQSDKSFLNNVCTDISPEPADARVAIVVDSNERPVRKRIWRTGVLQPRQEKTPCQEEAKLRAMIATLESDNAALRQEIDAAAQDR